MLGLYALGQSALGESGFIQSIPPQYVDLDGITAKKRAKKTRPRFEYSIYNHPDFSQKKETSIWDEVLNDLPPDGIQEGSVDVDLEPVTPEPPPLPQVNQSALLPLGDLSLFSQSWAHTTPQAAAPPVGQLTDQDYGAESVFREVVQMMLSGQGGDGDDIIRELKSILYRET